MAKFGEYSLQNDQDKAMVSDYPDVLEKAFVIFRLTSFAHNLRSEISTTRKVFFYDNGVRNTIINIFQDHKNVLS